LDDLTDETSADLLDAFFTHHLLCLRTPPLSEVEFGHVARCFGNPQLQLIRKRRSALAPEVSLLDSTYKTPEAKPNNLNTLRLSSWHTDDSYFSRPAKATMLQALEIPSAGGQTKFCNTRKAWEDLDCGLKEKLAPLKAIHSYDTPRARARAEPRTAQEKTETPDVEHPLVRTHEDTGAKSIYFNPNRTDRILGMARKESDELLDFLYDHVTQERYQYAHEWRTGDILLWDNRCLLHAVNTDFPVGEPRRHQRILLEGNVPT
jgi:taurine dioxygenase